MYVAPVFTNKVASQQLIQTRRRAGARRMEINKRGRVGVGFDEGGKKIYKVIEIPRNSGNWRHYVRSTKITISGVAFFDIRLWQSFPFLVFNQFIKSAKSKSDFQFILFFAHILWVCNNTKFCVGFYLSSFRLCVCVLFVSYCELSVFVLY